MSQLSPKERYTRAYRHIRLLVHIPVDRDTHNIEPLYEDLSLLLTCNEHFHAGRKSPTRQKNHYGKICAFRKDLKLALESVK